MRQRKYGILSLDVSAATTGWALLVKDNLKEYGTIKTNPKHGRASRLSDFGREITSLLIKTKPTYVIIENGYLGPNVKTLKVLCEFAGVAKMCCMDVLGVEPFIMNVNIPRSHFGLKKKEDVFNMIVERFSLADFNFEDCNDITDACAQGVCFYEQELKKARKNENSKKPS